MPESSPPPTLLDRLDQEQDDVIRQLDALNSRIEEVLKQFGGRSRTVKNGFSCLIFLITGVASYDPGLRAILPFSGLFPFLGFTHMIGILCLTGLSRMDWS